MPMINCLLLSINLHIGLTTSCLLSNLPFAVCDHAGVHNYTLSKCNYNQYKNSSVCRNLSRLLLFLLPFSNAFIYEICVDHDCLVPWVFICNVTLPHCMFMLHLFCAKVDPGFACGLWVMDIPSFPPSVSPLSFLPPLIEAGGPGVLPGKSLTCIRIPMGHLVPHLFVQKLLLWRIWESQTGRGKLPTPSQKTFFAFSTLISSFLSTSLLTSHYLSRRS